jgi:peroxiredoxin
VTPERQLPHRWTYYIDSDGKILYVDKEVKTQSAGADIAARLEALGVKKK